jgi:hypothetical protein
LGNNKDPKATPAKGSLESSITIRAICPERLSARKKMTRSQMGRHIAAMTTTQSERKMQILMGVKTLRDALPIVHDCGSLKAPIVAYPRSAAGAVELPHSSPKASNSSVALQPLRNRVLRHKER